MGPVDPGGGPGPSGARPHLDPRLLRTRDQIQQELAQRTARGSCSAFLNELIQELKTDTSDSAGGHPALLSDNFSIDTLINNISQAASIVLSPHPEDYNRDFWAYTVPNTNQIFVSDTKYLSDHTFLHSMSGYKADFASTLLHEGFHLAITSSSGVSATDAQLSNALSRLISSPMVTARAVAGYQSASVGATFAKYCGRLI